MIALIQTVGAEHGPGAHVRQGAQLVQHKVLERMVGHNLIVSQVVGVQKSGAVGRATTQNPGVTNLPTERYGFLATINVTGFFSPSSFAPGICWQISHPSLCVVHKKR